MSQRDRRWIDLSERQMALLVILFGLLLYIPFAGSYGLWDPWETHYSEVARQMTERGDYISLWWPGSPRDADVFWSKPVLSFWMMSLAMRLAGHRPAGTIRPARWRSAHRAEWAARRAVLPDRRARDLRGLPAAPRASSRGAPACWRRLWSPPRRCTAWWRARR